MYCQYLLAHLQGHDLVLLNKLQSLLDLHICELVEHRGIKLEIT